MHFVLCQIITHLVEVDGSIPICVCCLKGGLDIGLGSLGVDDRVIRFGKLLEVQGAAAIDVYAFED